MTSEKKAAKGKRIRRRRFLTKKVQVKYAVMISAVMILMTGISQFYTYRTLQTLLPQILSTEIGSKISSLQMNLLIISIVYTVIMTIVSIYITHRMAGPVYRIEEDVRNMSENPSMAFRFNLRTSDEFQELADALNSMMQKLEANYTEK
ncbi:MAG: hypothetical protein ABIH89_00475 [Elusimicrobiota bacterium]